MSTQPASTTPPSLPPDLVDVVKHVPHPDEGTAESFDVKTDGGHSEQLVDTIEQIGEEQTAGFAQRGTAAASPRRTPARRTIAREG